MNRSPCVNNYCICKCKNALKNTGKADSQLGPRLPFPQPHVTLLRLYWLCDRASISQQPRSGRPCLWLSACLPFTPLLAGQGHVTASTGTASAPHTLAMAMAICGLPAFPEQRGVSAVASSFPRKQGGQRGASGTQRTLGHEQPVQPRFHGRESLLFEIVWQQTLALSDTNRQ